MSSENVTRDVVKLIQPNGWSSPLVGKQAGKFETYVLNFDVLPTTEKIAGAMEAAEHLCEWSRNLYGDAIGCTTRKELLILGNLFYETADRIDAWAELLLNATDRGIVAEFASHIRGRTGAIKPQFA